MPVETKLGPPHKLDESALFEAFVDKRGGMAKALYLVIRSRENWWVDFEGSAQGPYPSRENAALEARSMARFKAHTGCEAEVLVPDERGRYWVIWSSQYDAADGEAFTPRRVAVGA